LKNQYFGDVNDYRKYGFLSCLAETSGLRLGVVWLLTEDDGRNDGGLLAYLDHGDPYRTFDHPLYDALSRLRRGRVARSVRLVEEWSLLPHGTAYFDWPVSSARAARLDYMRDALTVVAGCPLLFFDPDNGIEVKSVPLGSSKSSKYVYWDELRRAYDESHSLVVYQHRQRVPLKTQVARLQEEIARRFRTAETRFVQAPRVLFVLISNPPHAKAIDDGIRLATSTWNGQLKPIDAAHSSVRGQP
jgi:hypothetical protein